MGSLTPSGCGGRSRTRGWRRLGNGKEALKRLVSQGRAKTVITKNRKKDAGWRMGTASGGIVGRCWIMGRMVVGTGRGWLAVFCDKSVWNL